MWAFPGDFHRWKPARWWNSVAPFHRSRRRRPWLHSGRGRVRDAEGQDRAGGDAQGRRHHGRRRRGAGPDRRGRRCLRGDNFERVPADIRRDGGVTRMSDRKITEIQEAVSIPVAGEVPDRPFRRGADPQGALRGRLHRRVRGADARGPRAPRRQVAVQGPVRLRGDEPREGAAEDLRGRRDDPKGEAGTGDIVNAVTHARGVRRDPTAPGAARGRAPHRRQGTPGALRARALGRGARAPPGRHLHGGWDRDTRGRVPLHAARRGRVFVGSGIFKSDDPVVRAKAIVEATTHFDDPKVLADVSAGLNPAGGPASPRARSRRRSGSRSAAGSSPPRWTRGRGSGCSLSRSLPRARERAARARRRRARVRRRRSWGLDGLVIPGGESTAMLRLAGLYGLDEAIRGYEEPILKPVRA